MNTPSFWQSDTPLVLQIVKLSSFYGNNISQYFNNLMVTFESFYLKVVYNRNKHKTIHLYAQFTVSLSNNKTKVTEKENDDDNLLLSVNITSLQSDQVRRFLLKTSLPQLLQDRTNSLVFETFSLKVLQINKALFLNSFIGKFKRL